MSQDEINGVSIHKLMIWTDHFLSFQVVAGGDTWPLVFNNAIILAHWESKKMLSALTLVIIIWLVGLFSGPNTPMMSINRFYPRSVHLVISNKGVREQSQIKMTSPPPLSLTQHTLPRHSSSGRTYLLGMWLNLSAFNWGSQSSILWNKDSLEEWDLTQLSQKREREGSRREGDMKAWLKVTEQQSWSPGAGGQVRVCEESGEQACLIAR